MKQLFYKHRWTLGFIALAFVIRLPLLWHMDYNNFPEFYRDYYVSSQISGGHWPMAGPPSMQANFRFGPAYYYLLAPVFWLGQKNPASLVLTGIILYALSAGVCYELFSLWFKDSYAARLGTLFYCISIYGLHLTSYISNPNFLPLFVLIFFYCLTKILGENSKLLDYAGLGAAYGIAVQLHTTAAFVLTLAAILAIITKRKILASTINYKKITAFFAAFIFVTLPYLIYNFAYRLRNVTSLLSFSTGHLEGGKSASGIAALLKFLSASFNPFDLNNSYTFLQPNSLYVAVALAALIALGATIYELVTRYPKSAPKTKPLILSSPGLNIIIGWLIAGGFMVLQFNRAIHDHYLIIFWPLPAVLIGWIGQWLKNRLAVSSGVIILVVAISILQAYSLFTLPKEPWSDFWPAYVNRYQNNPATPDIGFSPGEN